jgi:two-component system LytT family response regulator
MPSPTDSLSVLIVDDERPARRRIAELLRKQAHIAQISEAANGVEAVEAIHDRRPDLVFLDVQMPELDGFGVIEQVGPERMPVTIFVTAYDSYAIRAFEAHALDYLLKPFSDERCEQALRRAHSLITARRSSELSGRLAELVGGRDRGAASLDRLVVKLRDSLELVRSSEIDWLGAAGVYVEIHAGTRTYLHRATLGELEQRLDPRQFTRIHRSTIVAVDRIARLEPRTHGEHVAVLQDGTRLRVSRTYRAKLETRLGQPL